MATSRMYTTQKALSYNELCEEVLKDIRRLFTENQIREDGQIKRNPHSYTPWAARNDKYALIDRQRMMPMVSKVAHLNDKNIWQFDTVDLRVITTLMREEANRLDNEVMMAMAT